MILNTIVAHILKEFADTLEGSENFTDDLNKLLLKTYKENKFKFVSRKGKWRRSVAVGGILGEVGKRLDADN